LTLFAERGFAATKLEDVARAAHISKGTVYLYFPNKESLFRAVVRQELLPNVERIEAMIAAHQGSAADMLRMIASQMLQVIDTQVAGIPKLVLAESGNFPEIARFYAEEVVGRGIRLFTRILRRGVERGEFRPIEPMHLLPTLVGPMAMMVMWRHSIGRHSDLRFDTRAVIETHIDLLLRGLRPEPGA
jgi:AcrR family transcriptional regulator